jgi:anti-sigma factor RsiW
MKDDRVVAGLKCSEVLEDLSAYVDGELDAARRAQIDTHLAGCDRCERFGDAFGVTVGDLRRLLGGAEPTEDAARRDLLDKLHHALDEEPEE